MAQTFSCELVHHGAAASSSAHSVAWIPATSDDGSSMVVYSSHGLLNIAHPETVLLGDVKEEVWNVKTSLCTSTVGGTKRVITCLTHARQVDSSVVCVGTGFSDGTVNTWWKTSNNKEWKERVVMEPPVAEKGGGYATTDIDGLMVEQDRVALVTCNSDGAFLMQKRGDEETEITRLASFAANSVRLELLPFDKTIILVGTAHPRHNKIHVYTTTLATKNNEIHHCGHLSGHQDWITCFDWNMSSIPMLASGSQDAKIRLWRFATMSTPAEDAGPDILPTLSDDDDDASELDLSEGDDDEGEARLEIVHDQAMTSVTLEALLLGHEESVTSVNWHPNPEPYYGHRHILISSSMDRALLIWGPTDDVGGVWTPLTRVGSAGGILGGSIGSSLLGFVNSQVEPVHGTRLLGHAFGGALHFWSLETSIDTTQDREASDKMPLSIDEMATRNKWRATPCLTGHFESVTDLCWEAESGDYLLTVSMDQTCRLWAAVPTESSKDVWVELARPQVHGYDLNAITSVSTKQHKHLIASGADEKELRVFDAPLTTTRMLQAANGDRSGGDGSIISRVERAYIPSLGLSNKATARESAEEDTFIDIKNDEGDCGSSSQSADRSTTLQLPLERDLGVLSLWPEVRKLFGHNTELFCLASTVSAQSGSKLTPNPHTGDVLVASSAKARDVEAASIRIWDVEEGKCVQVLKGGHRSTVATLSFSADGRYLASSGKDRRLCLWRREESGPASSPSFSLASAIDSAHKRIIWSVHFCPHSPYILASGSRDGCINIWHVSEIQKQDGENETITEIVHSFEPMTRIGRKADSVTALSFAPKSLPTSESSTSGAIIALGLESGVVELWTIPMPCHDALEVEDKPICRNIFCTPRQSSHFSTICKLAWKPIDDEGKSQLDRSMLLASASADHGCRLWEMRLS